MASSATPAEAVSEEARAMSQWKDVTHAMHYKSDKQKRVEHLKDVAVRRIMQAHLARGWSEWRSYASERRAANFVELKAQAAQERAQRNKEREDREEEERKQREEAEEKAAAEAEKESEKANQ